MKAISPLSIQSDEAEAEWICWQKNDPLIGLTVQTASCEHAEAEGEEIVQIMPSQMVIHRPQYHAVLNRFSQAKQRTGQFSSWAT